MTQEKLAVVSAGLCAEIIGMLLIFAGFYPCGAQQTLGAKGCAALGGIIMLLAGLLIGSAR